MSSSIDSSRVYCSNVVIKRVGGAVAFSLERATLPGNASNKHVTILYRKGMKWTKDEIEAIIKESDRWMFEKYGSNEAPITFTINVWGPRSVKIDGDLKDLCFHLRARFGAMTGEKQRIPHCQLFKNNKDKMKTCHFKKHCPQKTEKKRNSMKTCYICKDPGHRRKDCPTKLRKKKGVKKLERMIGKIQKLKNEKTRI